MVLARARSNRSSRRGHEKPSGEAVMRTIGGSLLLLSLAVAACSADHDTTAPAAHSRAPGSSGSFIVTSAACGDVIVADLRLENDLSCAGDGLIVTGSGIRINLNGHTIAGAGTGVGIRVNAGNDVSIQGGIVRGFTQGMFVAASTGIVIKDNEFRENGQGMFVAGSTGIIIKDNGFSENGTAVLLQASSGNTIKANVARENTLRAFMIRASAPTGGVVSTSNDFVDNLLIDNPTGILIISQPGNTFTGNTISGSTVAAIDLPAPGASGNLIKGNLLTTSAAGIRFAAGWTGNTILGNTLQMNICAFLGPIAGNSLQGNILTGNATDLCP
jgi:parallel beta-helix repeat protein